VSGFGVQGPLLAGGWVYLFYVDSGAWILGLVKRGPIPGQTHEVPPDGGARRSAPHNPSKREDWRLCAKEMNDLLRANEILKTAAVFSTSRVTRSGGTAGFSSGRESRWHACHRRPVSGGRREPSTTKLHPRNYLYLRSPSFVTLRLSDVSIYGG
jgi:hypothetical protein